MSGEPSRYVVTHAYIEARRPAACDTGVAEHGKTYLKVLWLYPGVSEPRLYSFTVTVSMPSLRPKVHKHHASGCD